MRAALLAALLLAPLFLTVASGGTPTPKPWSPYDAVTEVVDVALASEGTTAAVALAKPVETPTTPTTPTIPTTPGGTTPRVATGDLAIFDTDNGFAYNGSGNTGVPQGRQLVAVSRDGLAIASVGLDTPTAGVPGLTPGQALATKVYHQRIAAGQRWAPDRGATNVSLFVVGNATDLLLSPDGNRIVLALNDNGQFLVRGFTVGAAGISEAFTFRQTGRVFDLGATNDLAHIAVAASLPEGNETHGALFHLGFSGNLLGTLYERSFNGSAIVAAGATPDGRVIGGDTRGRLLYANARNELVPYELPGATTNVTQLHVAAGGARLVAAAGPVLAMYNVTSTPSLIWNATLDGAVSDVALNHTGGTVLVAANGTGIVGFGDDDATQMWRFPGVARAVAVNAAGTMAAYSQRGVVSVVNIPRTISFEFPGGAKTGPAKPIKPLGSTTIELDVRNSGAGLERVEFVGPRELDLTLTPQESVVAVAPGESRRVSFIATAGRSFSGTSAFNVTARSLTSGAMDNVTVALELQTATNVTLVLNGTDDVTVLPGERHDILLGVINNGSRGVGLGLRATQQVSGGPAWNVTLEPSSFTLAPNTITTVRASVVPPADVQNGTSNAVTFTLEGANISDTVRVTFRINPTLGVEANAAGRVKFVEPGKVADYNVTVTNTGSLPRAFEAFFQATPVGGKNWAVDMDTSRFRLEPGVTRTIPVRIFAPADATPTDRVGVLIVARTIPELANETVMQSNVTLYANAVEPRPTTTTPTTNPLPGPGVVAVLVTALLLSTALRHRRRP